MGHPMIHFGGVAQHALVKLGALLRQRLCSELLELLAQRRKHLLGQLCASRHDCFTGAAVPRKHTRSSEGFVTCRVWTHADTRTPTTCRYRQKTTQRGTASRRETEKPIQEIWRQNTHAANVRPLHGLHLDQHILDEGVRHLIPGKRDLVVLKQAPAGGCGVRERLKSSERMTSTGNRSERPHIRSMSPTVWSSRARLNVAALDSFLSSSISTLPSVQHT